MDYLVRRIKWKNPAIPACLSDGKLWVGTLDDGDAADLTEDHAEVLAVCYVDPDRLELLAEDSGKSKRDFFAEEILPSLAHIRSGVFGEILCRSILQGWRERPSFPVMKWRYRNSKNDPGRGTDLIGYVMSGSRPRRNDLLVLCEVRTRSRSISTTVVKGAFDSVKKDSASRLAESIYFQANMLLNEGNRNEAKRLLRFRHPHKT